MELVYQWDQPFASVSGPPGSTSDMDILIANAACDTNAGGDPFEIFGFINDNFGDETTFGLMIVRFSGPNPGLMKVVNFGSGEVSIDEFATNSGTSWGHSAAQGGLGVGAANFRDTPAFAVNPPLIEAFSSAGGTPILFDTAGNRLPAAQVRQ